MEETHEQEAIEQEEESQEEVVEEQSEEETQEEPEAELPELSVEQRQKIIDEAIESGQVVDYETRFKPIYGSLKHHERELEALKKASPDTQKKETTETPKPRPEDFESYDKYLDARDEWVIAQTRAGGEKERKQREEAEVQERWDEKIAAATVKDPKILEEGYIPVKIAHLLIDTEHLVELARHWGKNPEEGLRLTRMSPIQAAREIGKLEAKFAFKPPKRTETHSPGPTSPIRGKEVVVKKLEDMTTEEFVAARDKAEGRI